MHRSRGVVALLSVVLIGASFAGVPHHLARAQAPADTLVVPGERIGKVKLTDRLRDVEGMFGKGTPLGRGLWQSSTFVDFPGAALSIIADDATGNLLWVSVCACGSNPWRDHATVEGMTFGATEDQIIGAFGVPQGTVADAQGKSLYYPAKGINFALAAGGDAAGRVTVYRIYWPNRSPGDALIVAGRRISGATLGASRESVLALLGGGYIFVRQGAAELYHWPHFALILVMESGRVAQITAAFEPYHEAVGLRYATAQGVGIGSTRDQVRAAFGEPGQRETRGPVEVLAYFSQGLGFNIAAGGTQAGRVVGISVFAPR